MPNWRHFLEGCRGTNRTASPSGSSAGTMEGLGLGMLVFSGCCQLNFSLSWQQAQRCSYFEALHSSSGTKPKQFSASMCSGPSLTGERGAEQIHSSNAPVQQTREEGVHAYEHPLLWFAAMQCFSCVDLEA